MAHVRQGTQGMTHRPHCRVLLGAVLATLLMTGAGPVVAQDGPDDRCDNPAPNVACADPAAEPEIADLIDWVMAADDGAVIHLTPEGVAHGRTCDGAAQLVEMASRLYARLPEREHLEDDLLWANPALTREVYAHAWATTMGSGRGNPVNVVFSDYAGDPGSFQSRIYRGPLLAIMCPGQRQHDGGSSGTIVGW